MPAEFIPTRPNRELNTNAEDGTLSFGDFKKSLGASVVKYTDAEIEEIRVLCDRIADVHFEDWLTEINALNV